MKLTQKQKEKITPFFKDKRLIELRKEVTLYKANDPSLALFRVQATNNICTITCLLILKKPLPKRLQKWYDVWMIDKNDMVRNYFDHLDMLLIKAKIK